MSRIIWGGGAEVGVSVGVGTCARIQPSNTSPRTYQNDQHEHDQPVADLHEPVEALVHHRLEDVVDREREDRSGQAHEEEARLVRQHDRDAGQDEAARHVHHFEPVRDRGLVLAEEGDQRRVLELWVLIDRRFDLRREVGGGRAGRGLVDCGEVRPEPPEVDQIDQTQADRQCDDHDLVEEGRRGEGGVKVLESRRD